MHEDTTCWTVIRGAAAGDSGDRQTFVRAYDGLVRSYLRARWAGGPLLQEIDDATQEVFVEAFRDGGPLDRVRDDRPGGFRAFLYGVVRNVARRVETKRARRRDEQPGTGFFAAQEQDETRLTQVFDRQWATAVMRQAADQQAEWARGAGDAAERRVELLRLRFREGRPIREIARQWDADPTHVHREYARARREFREHLLQVVAFHQPGSREVIERSCAELLAMLD